MDVMRRVGHNLRHERLQMGLTADDVEDRSGIKAGEIRRYERGERAVNIEALVILAVAIGCGLPSLLDGVDPRLDHDGEHETLPMLNAEEHNILRRIATTFQGDKLAFCMASGTYAALPSKYRREVVMEMMLQVGRALDAGDLKPDALPDNMRYLEDAVGSLYGL